MAKNNELDKELLVSSPDITRKLGSIFDIHIHEKIGRIYQAIEKVLPK